MPITTDPFGRPSTEPARPPARLTVRDHLATIADGHGFTAGRAAATVLAVVGLGTAGIVLWPRPAAPAPELSLPRASTTAPPAGVPATTTATTLAALVVDAAGEVQHPGVYRVAAAARVTDVLQAAGGMTERADRSRINLAAPVADGERIYVPAIGQQVPPVAVGSQPAHAATGADASTASGTAAPVNINTGSLEELDTLPGVGPTTAQAIIDHRTQNGPFGSVDELLDVRGIGDAKLAELRDRVVV